MHWTDTLPLIDCHAHADLVLRGRPTTLPQMLELFRSESIEYGLLLGRYPEQQIPLLKEHSDYAGFLIWTKPGAPGWFERVEAQILGNPKLVRGVKLHPSMDGYKAGVDGLEPLFASAQEHGFLVVTHTDASEYSHCDNFRPLLKKYPNVCLGLYHSWPLEAALSLLKDYPQTWVDTSFTACDGVVQRRIVEAVGKERVLMGLDAPLGFPLLEDGFAPHYRAFMREDLCAWFDEDRAIIEAIAFRNARRLLGISAK